MIYKKNSSSFAQTGRVKMCICTIIIHSLCNFYYKKKKTKLLLLYIKLHINLQFMALLISISKKLITEKSKIKRFRLLRPILIVKQIVCDPFLFKNTSNNQSSFYINSDVWIVVLHISGTNCYPRCSSSLPQFSNNIRKA